jgi:hypothetical protein
MKTKIFISLALVSVLLWSCSNQSDNKSKMSANDLTVQQADGTISLRLANAGKYNDAVDPSNNTAEWNVVFSKPGGYKIWLSSATKDTVNLNYSKSVKVNLSDNQFAAIPACDKVVHNSSDVNYPYFRADSFMGSVYISEPGEYNIQVISDKIMPKETATQNESLKNDSRLLAVIISPETR